VQAGDEVSVFGWADKGKVAIAYSPKCGRIGWVPAKLLKREPDAAQNDERPSVWVAKGKHRRPGMVYEAENGEDGYLTWDVGHYILTCKITDKPNATLMGTGINLATVGFGEFGVSKGALQKLCE
jgi:hypothetical protein